MPGAKDCNPPMVPPIFGEQTPQGLALLRQCLAEGEGSSLLIFQNVAWGGGRRCFSLELYDANQRVFIRVGVALETDRRKATKPEGLSKGFRREVEDMLLPEHRTVKGFQRASAVGDLKNDVALGFHELMERFHEPQRVMGMLEYVPGDDDVRRTIPLHDCAGYVRAETILNRFDSSSGVGDAQTVR